MQTRLRSATASPIAAWAPVLAGTVALLWLALVNGFPLLYYDSGAYLGSAFNRLVPQVDRPIVYSWFIFATSGNASPWLVIVGQSAIAAWVMRKAFRIVDPALTPGPEAMCILGTAALSGAAVYADQVSPDIFTGVLSLAIFVLVAGYRGLATAERWVLFALIAVGVGGHTSHAPIAAATLIAIVIAGLATRTLAVPALSQSREGSLLALAAIAIACILVSATNALQYGLFTLSPGAHVFLMGRLLADGPAVRHLQRACPGAGYRLCSVLEALPRNAPDFIWNNALLAKTDAWLELRGESWQIIRRTVAEEPGAVLANALRAGAQQLMRNESLTDLPVLPQDHGTLRTLARRYPGQYAAFERSLQQRGELEARGFRAYAWLLEISFAILTLTACMLAWRWRASHPAFLVLVAGCIGCYAANAFVCGALSMVSDRFGGRVSWPLVFAGLAALVANARSARIARAATPA